MKLAIRPHLQSLLTHLSSLNLRKGPLGSHNTLDHQHRRDNDPDSIAEHIIHVEVELLRATVHNFVYDLVKVACPKVQNVTVQLANADDELDGVSQRVLLDDAPRAEE